MKKLSKKQKSFIIPIAAILLSLFSVYCIYQNNALTVSEYEIENQKLPEEFNGFRIAQVSDFHNTRSRVLQESILEKLNADSPDIIVVTGDLADSRKTDTEIALEFTEKLTEIAPVYFAPGNHEARLGEIYDELEKGLKGLNVTVLRNSACLITKENAQINIAGIEDSTFYEYEDKFDSAARMIDEASSDRNLFTVMLSHRPEIFSVYAEKNLDLVFSGHAHGGQFVIPHIGGLFTPTEGLFPEFTQGVHKKANTTMVVSRGIGNSIFPIRINNRPELIFVTLRAEK